ncbi:MAG: RNA polymerase sigma factor [Cyclobacteriaceae bacterium]
MSNSNRRSSFQEEQQWIRNAQKDIKGFEPLYNRYYEAVFRFLFRRTGEEDLTADLCSQTFYKALSNISKFRWQGKPFGAWLFVIARNELKKHYRNQKQVYLIDEIELKNLFEIDEPTMQPLLDRVLSELQLLKELEIRIIELKYFEGASFKEISDLLGQKESTIKMKMYRAIDKVKKAIDHDEERF